MRVGVSSEGEQSSIEYARLAVLLLLLPASLMPEGRREREKEEGRGIYI